MKIKGNFGPEVQFIDLAFVASHTCAVRPEVSKSVSPKAIATVFLSDFRTSGLSDLLLNVPNVQVSDTTGDDQRTLADKKINKPYTGIIRNF